MKNSFFKLCLVAAVTIILSNKLRAQQSVNEYDWRWPYGMEIVTCRDDGFACLNHSPGEGQEHAVIKFNDAGKLVFRYDMVPEKIFKKFVSKSQTWKRRMFELKNGNLVVWFSAGKGGNQCPVDLYYYIIDASGKLLTATNVPFDKYKGGDIENAELDDVVMVNDNEFVLSVKHGGSCKEIFNNSPINKNFLFNLSNGSIRALGDLDGHRVVNCITGNNSVYLLTLPIRFYKNDLGKKSIVSDRLYHIWKFSSSFDKQVAYSFWQFPENNTWIDQMRLQGENLQVFFCQRMGENGEYGYLVLDAATLQIKRKKSFKTELYPHNVYTDPDKYFVTGTKLIMDATGNDMVFFHVEAFNKSSGSQYGFLDRKIVHAQVVQDGIIRNETMIKVAEEKSLFAVSQPNSKGNYLFASKEFSSSNLLCNLFTMPVPVYKYGGYKMDEEKELAKREAIVNAMKKRFVKDASVAEGTVLQIAELDKSDLYAKSSTPEIGRMQQVKAGKYLMRRGDGYYTGYVSDIKGKQHFVYGLRFFPGDASAFNNTPPPVAIDKKPAANPPKQTPPKTVRKTTGPPSEIFKSLDRSRPFTIKLSSSQRNSYWRKKQYEEQFKNKLEAKGLSQAVLDRIGELAGAYPLDTDEIDDEKAAQWVTYIIADSAEWSMLWIPQNENSHMDEDYRPVDKDGFFISVQRDFEPTEEAIQESIKRCRVTNLKSLEGPKKAVMDGKTRYLDSLDRSQPYTLYSFTDKRNNAMDKGSFMYSFRAEFLNKGFNRAAVDKLRNIINDLPTDNIDNSIAEKWKGYIISESKYNYLVWIPQSENMHMPEAYRPKDPDGFAVFMFKR